MDFRGQEWYLPPDELKKYNKQYGGNPFILGSDVGPEPDDVRLNVEYIMRQANYLSTRKVVDSNYVGIVGSRNFRWEAYHSVRSFGTFALLPSRNVSWS